MMQQGFGEFPDEIGYIISPIIKILVMIGLALLVIAMFRKHLSKKLVLTRNLTLMFLLFFFSPLFSSFDILLNWEYLFSLSSEKTYFGMSLAFVFNGISNTFFYWFTLDFYYDNIWSNKKQKLHLANFAILEMVSTILALILRIMGNSAAFIFTVIHMVLSMYLFSVIIINSVRMEPKVTDKAYRKRINNIRSAANFGTIMIVLFAIDSIFAGVTIYSLVGWICLMGVTFYLYKGYI